MLIAAIESKAPPPAAAAAAAASATGVNILTEEIAADLTSNSGLTHSTKASDTGLQVHIGSSWTWAAE